jgi:serine/threonine protein kinase
MAQKEPQAGIEAERVSQLSCAKCQKLLDVSHLSPFVKIKCPGCGMEQIVPAKFGSFLLVKQLGAGGMGVIYRAIDRELGRKVAIKVMKKSLSDNIEFVNSFRHEAQAAAALNHRNVVQIYSFGQYKGQWYIVMELVDGGRLDDMIEKGKPFNERRAIEIHLEVAEGLMAASEVGLVHGDIKPANILFGKNDEAKVVDFGLARYIGEQQQGAGVWGTPYYIAPEKARGKKVDFRSDIYSLGATLFHVLTGKPPFDGPTSNDVVMARLSNPAPDILDFNPEIHPETAKMVARMLERDPAMRYPSYAALLMDMRAALKAAKQSISKPKRASVVIPVKIPETKLKKLLNNVLKQLDWKTVTIAATVAVLLAGGLIGCIFYNKKQTRLRQEAANRQLIQELRKTGEKKFGQIITIADFIDRTSTNLLPYAKKADEMAMVITQVCDSLTQLLDETDKTKEWLNDTEDIVVDSNITVQKFETANDLETARKLSDKIDNFFKQLIIICNSMQESAAITKEAFSEASAVQGKVLEEKNKIEAEKARERKRQQDAEAAKKLEKKKAEELVKMKPVIMQQELDEIEKRRGANAVLITQHKLDNIISAFTPVESTLTLAESRAVFTNVMEIYNAIIKLNDWLLKAINEAPCKNCWPVGSERKDIVKYDAKTGLTVSLGQAGSINIPWDTVTLSQELKIIDYYGKNSNLSEVQQAEILKQAALLCYESGVFKSAETYATRAYKANPSLSDDLNRLMPDILSAGE